MSLSETIESIKQARYDLAESNRKHRADLKHRAMQFIDIADGDECLDIIKLLINRHCELELSSSSLETAASDLAKELIELDADNSICPDCMGSGEGMHDGTRCYSCKGKGTKA